MCGISGFIKFDNPIVNEDHVIIEKMTNTLIHRGPDAKECHLFDNIALGFTRLSIIGLSNGMQPIYNEDESLVLICNGEIFNYIELKEKLVQKGHVFRTQSDIEVILHLYEEKGVDFLNDLNGQFAFALFDKNKKQMFCARDQMGIIPFFFTQVNKTFIFGSEIKAILEHPLVKPEVDLVGLDQVFSFAGLISPRTMFKNIHSLENGHFLLINKFAEITKEKYWDLNYPKGEIPLNGKVEESYFEEFEDHFENAIKLRLRSDVPSGLYVSGGLDSSMIAMKVSQLHPEEKKQAFSIDFLNALNSESEYQKIVARESNLELHQKTFLYSDITERLRQSIYHSECPIKETYNTASMSLSETVRSNNIKVVLSGEGADEFFAGYVGYRFDKMRSMNIITNEAENEEKEIRKKLWGDETFYYERDFVKLEEEKRSLYSAALNEKFDEFNCINHFVIDKKMLEGRSTLNKRAYIDYKIRLVDHLVSDHGDRMAMANSVEARYPFLDKDLIEYSTTVPCSLKLNEFTEKYILRKVASKFVPNEIIEREKFHFIAPGSPYLLQKNIEYINDILSYDTIKRQGFFNPDTIESLKKKYSQEGFTINAPYENDLLINVITFGIFLDVFIE